MTKREFVELIGNLYNYFGKTKMPNETQMNLWFRRLSHISGDYNSNIYDHIISNFESMPNNIPKAVMEGYELSNPNKGNLMPVTDCWFCKGQGFGTIIQYDSSLKRWHSFGVPCGECDANTFTRSERMTITQAIEEKAMPLIYRRQELIFYKKFGKNKQPDETVLSFFWDLTNKAISKFKKADRTDHYRSHEEIKKLLHDIGKQKQLKISEA